MRLRWLLLAVGLAVVGVAIGFFITRFLGAKPPQITATASSGQVVDIHLTTVAAVGDMRPGDKHPDWVSYLPTTFLQVPAGSTVRVTIDQQDGASGLRNEYLALVRGTIDNSMTVNGMTMQAIDPTMAAHTFSIPDIGVSVPLLGVASDAPPGATNTVVFEFRAPGPGLYHWQCFVPCGAGTLYGNGGPMQTLGYMAGELEVS